MARADVPSEPAEGAPLLQLLVRDEVPAEVPGAAVRALAVAFGIHPERATKLRVVIEELVREARARECFDEGDDDVRVTVDHDGADMRVEVVDQRLPIVASESRRLPSRRLAAMGFIDALHLANRGKAGNVVECRVSPDPPADGLHGVEVLAPDVPDVSDEVAAEVAVRPMRSADAGALVRCVFRCYGYSYKDAGLYEPKGVQRALRRGRQVSVVAVRPDGEIVGHAAYTFEAASDRVPEGGKLVVDPRFRGRHLAERLGELRASLAADHEVPGLWSECVANHPASQRGVLAVGGSEVGLLIGASPAGVVMADLANDNQGRRTLVATFTPVSAILPREVHLPAHLGDRLEVLATRLGIERTARTDSSPPDDPSTVLHVDVLGAADLAHLRVERVGADLTTRVGEELDALVPLELGAVHLDLPLADRSTGWAAVALEGLGFFWAAWVPEFRNDGDVLRLQRVGAHAVDVEHVVCARPEGEELRDWVLGEWRRVRHLGSV
jgi:hypothetical protein